jgi:hypothetical protein
LCSSYPWSSSASRKPAPRPCMFAGTPTSATERGWKIGSRGCVVIVPRFHSASTQAQAGARSPAAARPGSDLRSTRCLRSPSAWWRRCELVPVLALGAEAALVERLRDVLEDVVPLWVATADTGQVCTRDGHEARGPGTHRQIVASPRSTRCPSRPIEGRRDRGRGEQHLRAYWLASASLDIRMTMAAHSSPAAPRSAPEAPAGLGPQRRQPA